MPKYSHTLFNESVSACPHRPCSFPLFHLRWMKSHRRGWHVLVLVSGEISDTYVHSLENAVVTLVSPPNCLPLMQVWLPIYFLSSPTLSFMAVSPIYPTYLMGHWSDGLQVSASAGCALRLFLFFFCFSFSFCLLWLLRVFWGLCLLFLHCCFFLAFGFLGSLEPWCLGILILRNLWEFAE